MTVYVPPMRFYLGCLQLPVIFSLIGIFLIFVKTTERKLNSFIQIALILSSIFFIFFSKALILAGWGFVFYTPLIGILSAIFLNNNHLIKYVKFYGGTLIIAGISVVLQNSRIFF